MTPTPIATAVHDRVGLALRLAALGLAACGLSVLAFTVAGRIAFPWPLEWMEGGSLEHALRILHGSALYAAPHAEFIPYLYPPLAYVPMALGALLFGASLPAARAASLACTLAALVLLGRTAARRAGNSLAGFVAAGLFAIGFGYAGAFLDLARVDACFVMLVLAAAERLSAGRPRAALALLGLSVFAKQNGVLLLFAVCCALLVSAPRRHLGAVMAAVGGVLGAFVAFELTSGGWFGRYTLGLPADQPLAWPLLASFVFVDVLVYVPVLALVALSDGLTRLRARTLHAGDALLLVAIALGALGRAHAGGHDNVRLPAFALLCIAGTLPLCRALCSPEHGNTRRVLACFALALQFAMLWQAPSFHAPAPGSAAQFAALSRALERCAHGGTRVALDYAALGNQPFMHTMALSDLRLSDDEALSRAGTAALLGALRAPSAPRALAVGEHFAELDRVLGERYRECERLPAPALATGYQPGRVEHGRRVQIVYTLASGPAQSP
jgi:hypothetical protein